MAQPRQNKQSIDQERALLICVVLPDTDYDIRDPLGELRSLAKAAGASVVDEMVVKRARIMPGMYIGSGKAQEIANRVVQNDVAVVIFDNDLSPAQIRELEAVIGRKVLDRSEVILDIFAAHARTDEARLQIELAQLEYTYPRLSHMWSHLERVAGGASTAASSVGGIGTRGPGEKQLEIDRRLVKTRVSELKRRIVEIDARKQRLVQSRHQHFLVCLVGYTNAGKSTLMNLCTGAGTLVADRLFSTLDTRTRKWNLGEGQSVLLSDTVGFIRDLPHHLVASFRATLEEALGANLLLHVADASHPRVTRQIEAVQEVLEQLRCFDKETLLVLNKVDRITDPVVRTVLARKYPQAIFLSAATGENAEKLVEVVMERARGAEVTVTLAADYTNGRLMQFLSQHARVTRREYKDKIVQIQAVMSATCADALTMFGKAVEVVERSR